MGSLVCTAGVHADPGEWRIGKEQGKEKLKPLVPIDLSKMQVCLPGYRGRNSWSWGCMCLRVNRSKWSSFMSALAEALSDLELRAASRMRTFLLELQRTVGERVHDSAVKLKNSTAEKSFSWPRHCIQVLVSQRSLPCSALLQIEVLLRVCVCLEAEGRGGGYSRSAALSEITGEEITRREANEL